MAPKPKAQLYWITVAPASDLPDVWVAHCLDVDVVTQGDSILHALTMVHEAVSMVLEDDREQGLDPMDRRAPREYWDKMFLDLKRAVPIDLHEIPKRQPQIECLILQMEFDEARPVDREIQPEDLPVPVSFTPRHEAHAH